MGTHRMTTAPSALAIRPRTPTAVAIPRHVRKRFSLPVVAAVASAAFVLVSVVDPYSGAYASTTTAPSYRGDVQTFAAGGDYATTVSRDVYNVYKPPPPPPPKPAAAAGGSRSAPAAGTPDPGTAKAIAFDMVAARGWGQGEYDCLVSLWNKESGWNTFAQNKSSGAYGIPQALPGSKMASAGADWASNPATQITWGLGYIAGRYGAPCGAWGHSQAKGWY